LYSRSLSILKGIFGLIPLASGIDEKKR